MRDRSSFGYRLRESIAPNPNVRGRYSIVQSRRPLIVLSEIHRNLDRRLFRRWGRERASAAPDVRDHASSVFRADAVFHSV